MAFSACVGLLAGCGPPEQPRTMPVTGSYELTSPLGGTVGTILSAVRCGEILYLAGHDRGIHRLDLRSTEVMQPFAAFEGPIETLAADCDHNLVWAIGPVAGARGLRAAALDIGTGTLTRDITVPVACFPASAIVDGDELIVGGECFESVPTGRPSPRAASYYQGKRIGVRIQVRPGEGGEVRRGLVPFESRCDAAGACVGGSIAKLGELLLASLPVSGKIGVYTRAGDLQRTIPITSPAFKRDQQSLLATAGSEENVRWRVNNSVVRRIFVVSGDIVVAHYSVNLPAGWNSASTQRPGVDARANVFTPDGKVLLQDFPLADMPIGSDGESIFVVDYGADGRRGAYERVVVQRIRLPVN
jgi:hypothetical protein